MSGWTPLVRSVFLLFADDVVLFASSGGDMMTKTENVMD